MFAKFVKGYKYKFEAYNTDLFLDANNNETVYLNTANTADWQVWRAELFSGSSTDFRLVQQSTGRCLDANQNGDVYTKGQNAGDYQRWIAEINPKYDPTVPSTAYARIRHVWTGRYLARSGDNGVRNVSPNEVDDSALWTITIKDLTFQAEIDSMKYGEPTVTLKGAAVVDVGDFKNATPETQTRLYNYTKSITHSFSTTLTQTIGTSLTIEVSAGVPGIAEVKDSITLSFDISQSSTQTTSDSVDYAFGVSFQAAPETKNAAIATLQTGDVFVPFSATVAMKAVLGAEPLSMADTQALIQALLRRQGDPTYSGKAGDPNSVLVTLQGTLSSGNAGTDTIVSVVSVPYRPNLEPAAGAPGIAIRLTGTGAGNVDGVAFGSTEAESRKIDDNTLEVTVPNGIGGSVDVTVSRSPLISEPAKFIVLQGSIV